MTAVAVCVCVFMSHIPDWAGYILIIPQECVSPSFLPSVGGEPGNRPIIVVNIEMQYSHQECSVCLMDNFCHLSHTPLFPFILSDLLSPRGTKWQSHHQPKIVRQKCAFLTLRRPFLRCLHLGKFVEFIKVRPCCRYCLYFSIMALLAQVILISWTIFPENSVAASTCCCLSHSQVSHPTGFSFPLLLRR